MNRITHPLPIVRNHEDLAALAEEIKAEHEAVKEKGQESVEHARRAGERLAKAQDRLKEEHGWIRWLKEKVKLPRRTATAYLKIHQERDKWATVAHLGFAGVLNYLRTGKTGEEDEDEDDEKLPEYVTLSQWQEASKTVRARLLHPEESKDQFNDQGGSEKIEWALWSWNPITGCLHNCPYCYARDIANRFYEQKFEPSLWSARLLAPSNSVHPEERIARARAKNTPEGRAEALGLGNVFVCSMADLFGRWVPAEWIEAVLNACREAPQWTFLFLTKFPQRMAEFDLPENGWFGTTVDCQARVANAEKAFRKIKAGVKWLSCEPLIEPLHFEDLSVFHWIVVGGASASAQTPAWIPPRQWFLDLERAAKKAGCMVYEKSNLWQRIREYPGLPAAEPKQAPEPLRYLPTDAR